jgi:hypothetical protein
MKKKLARSQVAFFLPFHSTYPGFIFTMILFSITWKQLSANKFIYLGKVFLRLMKNPAETAYKFMVLANYFMELTILVLKGSVA